MYLYIYMYICMHIDVYMYMYMYIYIYICIFIYLFIYLLRNVYSHRDTSGFRIFLFTYFRCLQCPLSMPDAQLCQCNIRTLSA